MKDEAGRGRLVNADDLQIAGLTPMSTVDWPGKLVASVFCQGCPWLCPYCHNHAIIDPTIPGVVAWASVEDLLSRRRGLLDGVVFSGGEATRQQALIPAMRRVREMGFLIGLHTAGPYPHRLREVLAEGLVDWVGIDIKAMPDTYQIVAGRQGAGTKAWEALDVLLEYAEPGSGSAGADPDEVNCEGGGSGHARSRSVDYEVRLTVYPDGPRDGLTVAREAFRRGVRRFALQQARAIGAPDGFRSDAVGWDDQVEALARDIEQIGFDTFAYRPAH